MEIVVFFPGLITTIALVLKAPEKVFRYLYFPILMLLPQIFTFHINRIPDLSFAQAAIIPIFFFTILTKGKQWIWSLTDVIIIIFFTEMVYSEYTQEGIGSTAQQVVIFFANMIFPYALAKLLIHPSGRTVSWAKTITIVMYINILLSVYEERFMVNPYIQFFQFFFPGQGGEWPSIQRFGLVRIAGPLVQPIIFAIACAVAFFFNYWLTRNKYWGRHYRYTPDLPLSKGWLFGIVIFMGLILTFSRGPLLALFLGFLFMGVGYSKYPWPSFLIRTTFFVLFSLIISQVFQFYSGIATGLATSDEAMTLSYRTTLVEKYSDIMWEKPLFGWGANSWPRVANTVSVDNQYIWLTLKHGFIGTAIYGMLMVNVVLRLLKRGLRTPLRYVRDRTFDFTCLGVYLCMVFSFATVYMGLQMEPLFFLITGWIEGFIHTPLRTDEEWDRLAAEPRKLARGY